MSNRLRVFADTTPLRGKEISKGLNGLMLALWNDMDDTKRQQRWGARFEEFELCQTPGEAQFCALVFNWEYYVKHGLVHQAVAEVEAAKRANKPVLVFNPGDFPAKLPFNGVILLENSGYYSRRESRGNRVLGLTAVTADNLVAYCNGVLQPRQHSVKPVVGFCGQAAGSRLDFWAREARRLWRKLAFLSGFSWHEPPPFETTRFRHDVLASIQANQKVESRFIFRKLYRAGYQPVEKDVRHPSRVEFINNILETDYTVCMRGGGNFSVRFYEALCLGRIPIFIDTDCLLPFDDRIRYRDYFVWVGAGEDPVEKTLEFHGQFSAAEFAAVQQKCRELWVRYFSADGYYRNLAHVLREML